MHVLRGIDKDGVVRFDLNDPTGAANPFGLKTRLRRLDLSAPKGLHTIFTTATRSGGRVVHSQDELVTSVASVRTIGTDAADRDAAIAEITRLVRRGIVAHLQYQMEGGALKLIDLEAMEAPALMRGQDNAAFWLYDQLDDFEGMSLVFLRQPYMRLPQITSAPQLVTNHLDTAVRAFDAFKRTTVNGWGASEIGGAWTLVGTAADFDVATANDGRGTIVATAAGQEHRASIPVALADVDVSTSSSVDKVAAGGNQENFVTARGAGTTYYRAVMERRGDGTTFLRLDKVIAGAVTNIAAAVDTGLASGAALNTLRLSVIGDQLRVKCFQSGQPEPATWLIDITDAAIPAAGYVGVGTILAAGANNAPVTWSFDDLIAWGSVNGRQATIEIEGSEPALVSLELDVEAGSKIQAIHVASSDRKRRVIQLQNLARTDGSNVAQRFADKDASNGIVYRIPTVAFGQPQRFARLEVTEDPATLQGVHDVYLRVKHDVPATTSDLRLAWGPSLADPAPHVGPTITHDSDPRSGTTPTTAFVEKHVGRMNIRDDLDLEGIALELYRAGIGILWLDCVILVPVESASTIEMPYVARRSLSLNDVVLDGAGEQDNVVLDVLPVGRYRLTWVFSAENSDAEVVRFKIINSTTPNSQPVIGGGIQESFSLEFDADGVTSYTARVEMDTFDAGVIYTVHERWLDLVPVAVATERIVTDPEHYRIEKRDVNDHVMLEVGGSGSVPLVLDPGTHELYLAMYEPRHAGYYREPKSALADAVTLTAKHWPLVDQ